MRTVALATFALIASCTDTMPEPKSTQLDITITSPTDVGSQGDRIDASERTVTVNIQAVDQDDVPDPTYNKTLSVYTHYLGTLTPYLTGMPLQTIQMNAGVAMGQVINLPPVYGPTTIWFDDDSSSDPTYAAGTSATLWYRDPFTSDLQRPTSESSIDALTNDPVNGKNVSVAASQYGAMGRLVVTSVYSQGFTVADVKCADANGTPPCVGTDYGYMDVFSYSAPLDQESRYISEGEVIDGYAGGVSEFDGLTELGFPQSFVNADSPVINTAMEPAPAVFDPSWFGSIPLGSGGNSTPGILFERNESGMIEVDNSKVCALDSDYTTYKQWKLDPSGMGDPTTCAGKNIINVVTAGTLDLDPGTLVGQTVPRVVGNFRPINIGSFNIWIIYPRSMADITTN